jgi:hypothetical protein
MVTRLASYAFSAGIDTWCLYQLKDKPMTYKAHNWVILELEYNEDKYYKVLAQVDIGLSGWRLNSGISKVIEYPDYYEFYGSSGSGSYYTCPKLYEGLSNTTTPIFNLISNKVNAKVIPACNILQKHLLKA